MDRWAEQELAGWGRYPTINALATRPERVSDVTAAMKDRSDDPVLAFGLG
jgi:hypothetical protein